MAEKTYVVSETSCVKDTFKWQSVSRNGYNHSSIFTLSHWSRQDVLSLRLDREREIGREKSTFVWVRGELQDEENTLRRERREFVIDTFAKKRGRRESTSRNRCFIAGELSKWSDSLVHWFVVRLATQVSLNDESQIWLQGRQSRKRERERKRRGEREKESASKVFLSPPLRAISPAVECSWTRPIASLA